MADCRIGMSVDEAVAAFARLSEIMAGGGESATGDDLPDGLLRCEYCGVVTDRRTGVCDRCGAPLNPR